MDKNADETEVEEVERAAAWRLLLVDANPTDRQSAAAARVLTTLADDLSRNDYQPLRTELRAICNWLSESDLISDYAVLSAEYRMRVGISENPASGADYLRGLLAIAQSLV